MPVDEHGIVIDELLRALRDQKPAFLYTIPSFHNPTGICASDERRRRLVALSVEHEFLVVADEVYQLLHYDGIPPPALGTMIDSGSVLSLGSFAKILAPGMRLGWIQAADKLRQRLLAHGFVNSGGSINHFSSHVVRHAIDRGLLASHIDKLRIAYGSRVAAMDDALRKHFSDIGEWH